MLASQENIAFLTTKYEKIAKFEHFLFLFFLRILGRGEANVPSAPFESATDLIETLTISSETGGTLDLLGTAAPYGCNDHIDSIWESYQSWVTIS